MFRKTTIIKGLIILLTIGILATLGWAGLKMAEEKEIKTQPTEEKSQKETLKEEYVREEPEVNRIAKKIIEDYYRKLDILQNTYKEKSVILKKSGRDRKELHQLSLLYDEQKRLIKQEKERQREELIKKYLEPYIMKEILFVPWGSKKGEAALRGVEYLVQGITTTTARYGPSLEVDEDGNIYILNREWGELEDWQTEIKKIDNPYIYKYGKIKIRKGNAYEEKYEYLTSFSLKEIEKNPDLIKKKSTRYRYDTYRPYPPEEKDRLGLKVIDIKTGETIGNIDYAGLSDGETYIASINDPLGEDTFGNIYVLVDNTMVSIGPEYEHGWILKVHKYNKKGTLLAIIELFKEIEYLFRYDGQKDRIKIDKEGNIYQLLGKEDGVHILKWEIKK